MCKKQFLGPSKYKALFDETYGIRIEVKMKNSFTISCLRKLSIIFERVLTRILRDHYSSV